MGTAALDLRAGRYGLRQVVRAEVIKLASLRSTRWTLLVALVGSLGVSAAASASERHHPAQWYQGFDPTNNSLAGLLVAVLCLGVLGALAATGEHGSGTIRASLAAAPRRPLLLAGKVVVVGTLALAVGEALSFACFALGQAILAHGGAPHASLTQPGVLRAVALSGAYLSLLALLGLGLGLILRHTAGALAAFVGIMFLVPIVLQHFYAEGDPLRFTPLEILTSSVAAVLPQSNQLSAPVGFGLMALCSAAVLAVAVAALVRRDA